MGKINNRFGFTAVEGLLIVLILAVISFGGYYVWHTQRSNKTSPTTASTKLTKSTNTKPSQPSNPYVDWKNATLKYEQVSYQYPADWTVSDQSSSQPKGVGCVYPGTDLIYLTSPSNHQVVLRTGIDCFGGSGAKTFKAIPSKSLGESLYITLASVYNPGDATPTDPTSACLSTTTTQTGYPATNINSKNIFVNGGTSTPKDEFCYFPYLANKDGNVTSQTVAEMENSVDFKTAQLIFESLHY